MASIIIFIKILSINKIASILGFIGVTFRSVGNFLVYFLLLHDTRILITGAPQLLEIVRDIFFGIGLILGVNISSSVFFRNSAEAVIKFYSQTQGNIKAIILEGIQAISYIPSYVNVGTNSIEAKFPKLTPKGDFMTILLDNGSSIDVRVNTYSNKP
ncbi:hypothetical protein [Metallosphaera hakonensis]|uniref:hypothetical protein n=1 Tax=Metallosphaera hakonensis TaxID=79601 RepID=UPI0014437F42|nr:hypothetical protein [Metallosphaera hakonensis]